MTSLRSVNYIAVRASPPLCPSALPLPSRTFPHTALWECSGSGDGPSPLPQVGPTNPFVCNLGDRFDC